MPPTRRESPRQPTMRDVAAVAEVSLKTVSRVVNGETTVDASMTARVHSAIALLGYRRDATASALRRSDRASASIGLIVEDVANPFHSWLHRGVEDLARARGVLTFAGSSEENPELERELASAFCARRVDGLVIVPAGDDQSYLLRERENGVALVFVDRPPGFLPADAVLSDNFEGARAGVLHLLDHGHREIAFLGDRLHIHTARERLRGYRAALRERGIAGRAELVTTDLFHAAAGAQATRALLELDAPPTALFTSQNLITLGAVHALRDCSRRDEIALVGFDDFELADALQPAITVIAQEALTMGRQAAELLFARLDGDASPFRTITLPTTLIPRGSGEIRPR